jgi:hypothetical protein
MTDFASQPANFVPAKNPYATDCTCGQSKCMLRMPFIHCPKCHVTWEARGLTPPAFCKDCRFNLRKWRARNNIQVAAPEFV